MPASIAGWTWCMSSFPPPRSSGCTPSKRSPEEVLDITGEIISYVRDHCDLCMFSAMDATRTDPDYLIQVFRAAAEAGATIINVPDTVGVYTPIRHEEAHHPDR